MSERPCKITQPFSYMTEELTAWKKQCNKLKRALENCNNACNSPNTWEEFMDIVENSTAVALKDFNKFKRNSK